MGSSFSSSNNPSSKSSTPENTGSPQQLIEEEYVNLEKDQILRNQLSNYLNCLNQQQQSELTLIENSFMQIAESNVINIMGKKQCESFLKYDSFSSTELNIMRSIHKLPHFNTDKNSKVKHLLDPLRKSFIKGSLYQVRKDIQSTKDVQEYKGYSLTTMDYQLLDILDYMADLCLKGNKNDAFDHWLNIFDILFRGTNIKISNIKSENDNIITFKCHDQITTTSKKNNTFGLQDFTELSCCFYTVKDHEKETIDQNESILLNKSILDNIIHSDNDVQILYTIGIHLVGFTGYMYSIRHYKGVYIASQVCENTIFIPQTVTEFQSLLFHDCVLEMLCNLKRYYVGTAKILKNAHRTE